MDPTWIAHRFLPDLGLPQYTDVFEEQLCDGHVLNTLTRRDLEKYFSVHRKFHQSSILHAIELLRRIDFNKEVGVSKCSFNFLNISKYMYTLSFFYIF